MEGKTSIEIVEQGLTEINFELGSPLLKAAIDEGIAAAVTFMNVAATRRRTPFRR